MESKERIKDIIIAFGIGALFVIIALIITKINDPSIIAQETKFDCQYDVTENAINNLKNSIVSVTEDENDKYTKNRNEVLAQFKKLYALTDNENDYQRDKRDSAWQDFQYVESDRYFFAQGTWYAIHPDSQTKNNSR